MQKKERKARNILHALVVGVNPSTGEKLPPGTVLQEAEVLRALLAGVMALDMMGMRERERRRSQADAQRDQPGSAACGSRVGVRHGAVGS